MKALAIAATGMSAQQLNVEVIANNISNMNTTGFKRARAEFTDLLYQAVRVQEFPTAQVKRRYRKGPSLALVCGPPQSAICIPRAL